MQAIILAGGMGTRLRSVISEIPKPMAPVCGVPFLKYIFKYLKNNKINKIVLSVGYKWQDIRDYFGYAFEDVELIYSVEDQPLGTGGAIKKAINYIETDNLFIINGDTYYDVPLEMLLQVYDKSTKLVMSLKHMREFDRYGCVKIDSGFVKEFHEKAYYESGYINGGVYLSSKELFNCYNGNDVFSFEKFIEENYKKINIKGVCVDKYFIDIGIPEDYKKAQIYFAGISL